MSTRPRGGLRLAPPSGAGPQPTVRTVLAVRLDVDEHHVATLPRRWNGATLPAGMHCRIDAGRARRYVNFWNELPALVRDCASVEITGLEPECLADIRGVLAAAFTEASPAC